MNHNVRWTIEKIRQRLALIEPLVYRRQHNLADLRYHSLADPNDTSLTAANIDTSDWPAIAPGTYWGQRMSHFVLRGSFAVPPDWTEPVALVLPIGVAGDFIHPEALAYVDGVAYAAIDRHHQEILLPEAFRGGETHQLALQGWTGLMGYREGRPDPQLFMQQCRMVQIDQPTRDFIATARVTLDGANALDENHPARDRLLNALDAAFKTLDTREPFGEAFYDSVAAAHQTLRQMLEQAGPPMDIDVLASGHAHIDVAWLWPLDVTQGKAARTFHTALRLMEQFPDYYFTQSQPQLYDYVRQDHPALFEAIKDRVDEGRWEPIGGMWVEADCNLTGAESLVRQFLLGRRFFEEHFGPIDSPVMWLPDVFGYAWALPQIIKKAGLDYFMTIKISWNQYNRLPYDSFWWQGLDGTRVLTHFSSSPEYHPTRVYASTYNAKATPSQIFHTWHNFQQKDRQSELLHIFGHGDGGGGPTREMLENIRELNEFPAMPRTRNGKAIDFFRRLEAESGPDLPTWNGELYLEYHRGTYTTQSRNKRANRKSEFLLHDAEFVAAVAALHNPDYTYPHEQLRRAWELVCLNQFHDIIPGSSINQVYVDSLAQYAEVTDIGQVVRDEALQVIAEQSGGDLLVINPGSFARNEVCLWEGTLADGHHLQTSDGQAVLQQPSERGTWLALEHMPPYSVTALQTASGPGETPDTGLAVSPTSLENQYLRVTLNAAGDIIGLYDKSAGREILPPDQIANQFLAFEDRPMNYDAWDIDIYYEDKHWLSDDDGSVEVVEAGPLRATLRIKRRILNSTYTQEISLDYNSPQLTFDTHIDWRERHILLKVAFPVDVLAPNATFDIQWGNVERPTHRNTSWDWARFETCAHKWVDLSEGNYGVSLLNDCKYGHDIQANVIRLSLLRGPTNPDPEADQGEHHFSYALYPHQGGWGAATVGAAYALNNPVILSATPTSTHSQAARSLPALAQPDRPNVVIETVKQAEDGKGLIVRCYENQRQRGPVTLSFGFDVAEAWLTNLLEENERELEVSGRDVNLSITPYEIVTLRLLPA